jgi:hypothetical protein
MNDERNEFGLVTPARNAVDEALGLTEDPAPDPAEEQDPGDTDEPEPDAP